MSARSLKTLDSSLSEDENTVEPSLSGHPRGTGKWPLNEVGHSIEVCHK